MIAAFLCGLFYGAFLLRVYQRAETRRWADRLIAQATYGGELSRDEECLCDECCGSSSPIDYGAGSGSEEHIEV